MENFLNKKYAKIRLKCESSSPETLQQIQDRYVIHSQNKLLDSDVNFILSDEDFPLQVDNKKMAELASESSKFYQNYLEK
jgi:hypothetical protein